MSEEMAVQAVRAAFGAQAAAQAGEVSAAAPEASAGQVAAFEEAMRAAGLETVPAAATATVTETTAADGRLPVPFLDRVSEAFVSSQETAQGITARLESLSRGAGDGMMSAAELMELQYQTAYLKFHLDLVSKVVDRASQAVQTLVKNS